MGEILNSHNDDSEHFLLEQEDRPLSFITQSSNTGSNTETKQEKYCRQLATRKVHQARCNLESGNITKAKLDQTLRLAIIIY